MYTHQYIWYTDLVNLVTEFIFQNRDSMCELDTLRVDYRETLEGLQSVERR